MSAAETVLLAPGLLGDPRAERLGGARALAVAAQDLALEGLERYLSRAAEEPSPWSGPALDRLLFEAFSVGVPPGVDCPVGPVTARCDGIEPGGDWVARADPVHLLAGISDLEPRDPSLLGLTRAEAEAFAEAVNEAADARGWRVEVGAPERWYLRLAQPPAIETVPLSDAVGRPLEGLLEGADAPRWRRDLNEAQMLLHAAPGNREREAAGRPTVNSIWVWGGGRLPAAPAAPPWALVVAEDALSMGLAELCGCETAPPASEGPREIAGRLAPGQRALVVLDAGRRALATGDLEGWRAWLDGVDAGWAGPLLELAARRRVASLLVAGDGRAYRVGRREARRWWRRTHPFADFLR